MDPLIMAGAWAGALLAIIALGRLAYHGFLKAVKAAIGEELDRVWKDQDEIERRLTSLEVSMQYLREQIADLRRMMQQHVEGSEQ
jgi:hypothetical protein